MMYIVINKEIDMKVVADVSKCGRIPEYLTAGKKYDVESIERYGFYVVDNEGVEIYCLFNGCPHLLGGTWRIVEE